MVSSEKKLANATGSTMARACDGCMRKTGQWCWAADDTFFCRFCDALVQSANPLARGRERVRLKTASVKISSSEIPAPAWHHGFMKKSRIPRDKKHASHRTPKLEETPMITFNPLHVVPEIETDEPNTMNSDEQFCYQVPVFDPFSGEQFPADTITNHTESEDPFHLNSMNGLTLPTDMELAEFAADMESLLGKSLDHEEAFDAEALGMVGCRLNDQLVKVEDDNSEVVCDDHVNMHTEMYDNIHAKSKKSMKMLKLDYEGIFAGWDDDRSPWTTGNRPELDPNDCWPDGMVGCENMRHCLSEYMGTMTTRLDAEREARVSRYREKRQIRLFSKKIRYEVRKLNAEKRPRMKGRFVKRTSFAE